MDRINILSKNIEEMKVSKYIIFMGLIGFFWSVLFSNIVYFIAGADISKEYYQSDDVILSTIISAIIISPFIETLFFQALPLSLAKPYKIKIGYKIMISAFCFALIHIIYNIFYAGSAFFIGVILAYSFVLYDKKKGNPILVVTLVHSLINLLSLVTRQALSNS